MWLDVKSSHAIRRSHRELFLFGNSCHCLANTILHFPAIGVLFYRRLPPGAIGPRAPVVGFADEEDAGVRVDQSIGHCRTDRVRSFSSFE